MTFSELAQLLYPHCGCGDKEHDFVTVLIENLMEEPKSDKDKTSDDNGGYNPVEINPQ